MGRETGGCSCEDLQRKGEMEMSTWAEIGWKSMLGGQVYGKDGQRAERNTFQTIFGY